MSGTSGDDSILGSSWNNYLSGYYGNDTILGFNGHESLYGENGADSLLGGNGNDFLRGDEGPDTYHGDAGADTFDAADQRFYAADPWAYEITSPASLPDRILDFNRGQADNILNRSEFVGGSNFQIGWSRYEQNDEQILS